MQIRVLGPLELYVKGKPLRLGAPKQRTVLGLLLVRGDAVPVEEVLQELWEDEPPASALMNVRSYISGLRRTLSGASDLGLQRRGAGYFLDIGTAEFDLQQFRLRAVTGRSALVDGDVRLAASRLREAQTFWKASALTDVPLGPTLTAWRVSIHDQRFASMEDYLEALLGLGSADEAVVVAGDLMLAAPLRERAYELLMQAKYQMGDVAGALAVWDAARRAFTEQLGIEPGEELRRIHKAILNRDPSLPSRNVAVAELSNPAAVAATVPKQLPRDVSGFIGRASHLDVLDGLLTDELTSDAGGTPAVVAIAAVAGTAGVGKTSLAVHWAHRVKDRFPDGQVHINLRGFDADGAATSPSEALRALLAAFDIPPQRIPSSLDARVGLYRSTLAGKRVLILLDNARDAEQVRPLLPGTLGSLVVVTSRSQMAGLVATDGARPLTVDLMTVDEARDMLGRRIGWRRVSAEPDAVDAIIAACARLPMALAIVAARAVTHPTFSLAAIEDQLRHARGGLDAFETNDPVTNMRTVFSWSYRTLSDTAASMFRLLSLQPELDISVWAAASLAGLPLRQVRPRLSELAHAHLITEHAVGRYASHDLLRAYAAELAEDLDPPDVRQAATHRSLDHYLRAAYGADRVLRPDREPISLVAPPDGVTVELVSDDEAALFWFSVEHRVLLAAVTQAARTGYETYAWQLAWCLENYFDWRGHWGELAEVQTIALGASRRQADLAGQAHMHRGLARAHTRRGTYEPALEHLGRALHLFTDLEDRAGRAATHRSMGVVLARQGHHRAALEQDQQALDLHRAAGDLAGQALTLNNIGFHYGLSKDFARSLELCQQALVMHQQLKALDGEARTWGSIAHAHLNLGNHADAVTCSTRAAALFQQLGDRTSLAETLGRLGHCYAAAGDTAAARTTWERALKTFEELGHPEAAKLRARLADTQGGLTGQS